MSLGSLIEILGLGCGALGAEDGGAENGADAKAAEENGTDAEADVKLEEEANVQ
jgi:hypothetical protein